MSSLTLSIPDELREKMKQFPEINWSEVARQAINDKARMLEKMNQIFASSPIKDEEVSEIAAEIKKRVLKKHKA